MSARAGPPSCRVASRWAAWPGRTRPPGPAVLPAGGRFATVAKWCNESWAALRRPPALDHFRTAKAYGGGGEVRDDLFRLQPLAVLEVLKEGDLRAARRLIDGISTSYPDPAVPVFLRAVAAHMQGEVAEAVEGYAESARLAEEHVRSTDGLDYEEVRGYAMSTLRAAIAHPPQEGVGKWREVFIEPLEPDLSSAYFTVYAPTDNQAGDLAEVAGEIYRRASKELLGRVPSKDRIEVVVHATRAAYIAADPVPPDSPLEGVTIPREQTGGCCYDTLAEARFAGWSGPSCGPRPR